MISGIAPESIRNLLPPFAEPNRISYFVAQNHHYQLKVGSSKTEHHRNSFMLQYVRIRNVLPSGCIYNQHGELGSLQALKISVNSSLKEFSKKSSLVL